MIYNLSILLCRGGINMKKEIAKNEKEIRILTKKSVILIYSSAIFLFILGFLFIIVCGLLKENRYGNYWFPLVGLIGCFTCFILSIVILLINCKSLLLTEATLKEQKYKVSELFTIDNVDINKLNDYIRNNFKNDNEIYHKKCFSFTKDFIRYVFAFTDFTKDLQSSLNTVCENIDKLNFNDSNIANIIIVKCDTIEGDELTELKEFGKNLYLEETIIPQNSYLSVIPVIYVSSVKKLYMFNLNKKLDISVYNQGCKKLRLIIKKIKK